MTVLVMAILVMTVLVMTILVVKMVGFRHSTSGRHVVLPMAMPVCTTRGVATALIFMVVVVVVVTVIFGFLCLAPRCEAPG